MESTPLGTDVRIEGINPAVGRADNESRGARKRRHVVSEQSWNRYVGGSPRRYVSYARVGEAAAPVAGGSGGGSQGHEIPGTRVAGTQRTHTAPPRRCNCSCNPRRGTAEPRRILLNA